METNQLPSYDRTDNPTGCCPRFDPTGWDDQLLHFENKPFVRASTIGLFHVPLNMGSVFRKTFAAIQRAHAEGGGFAVLSRDTSAWRGEHLFAVDHDVSGREMVHLSGDFITKVFDGPFSEARAWCARLDRLLKERGQRPGDVYFFYTTCPRCAKMYGHNYVIGFAKVS